MVAIFVWVKKWRFGLKHRSTSTLLVAGGAFFVTAGQKRLLENVYCFILMSKLHQCKNAKYYLKYRGSIWA